MEETIRLGRYRHFKGKEYLEPYVVYQALYGEGGIWVRPASMWNELVERDGKAIQRFTFIEE